MNGDDEIVVARKRVVSGGVVAAPRRRGPFYRGACVLLDTAHDASILLIVARFQWQRCVAMNSRTTT